MTERKLADRIVPQHSEPVGKKDEFDRGWDACREATLANCAELERGATRVYGVSDPLAFWSAERDSYDTETALLIDVRPIEPAKETTMPEYGVPDDESPEITDFSQAKVRRQQSLADRIVPNFKGRIQELPKKELYSWYVQILRNIAELERGATRVYGVSDPLAFWSAERDSYDTETALLIDVRPIEQTVRNQHVTKPGEA